MAKGIRNEEHYRKVMPKVIFRNAIELAFWGYVTAIQSALPSVTLKETVNNFREDFDLGVDEFPEQSALKLWTRLRDEAKKFKEGRRCIEATIFDSISEMESVKLLRLVQKDISAIKNDIRRKYETE